MNLKLDESYHRANRVALKVLHISPCFLDPHSDRNGGVAGYIKGLATAQAEAGLDVKVVFPNVDMGKKLSEPNTALKDGVEFECIENFFGKKGWFAAIRAALDDVQIVHTHTPYSIRTEFAMALGAGRNIKFIVHSHGKFTAAFRQQRKFLKSVWEVIFWRFTVCKANRLIVSGIDEKKMCRNVGQFEIISNGFDKRQYKPYDGEHHNDSYFLFVGALEPRKNVDLIIRAFARVETPDVRLFIVGPDSCGLLMGLRDLSKKLGCEDRIEFKGPVFGQEKISLMQQAKALVLVSKGEGMANVMMEAMGCHLPMIYSDGCVFSEIADIGGGLRVLPTQDNVAQAMQRILFDDELRAQQKSALAELAGKYSWTKIALESRILYEKLLSET